jgi:hypothetical protein
MTADEILEASWRSLADNPKLDNGFPRGFWPDLARVAVEMALQGTLTPELDFRPTRSGSITVSVRRGKEKKPVYRHNPSINISSDNPFA